MDNLLQGTQLFVDRIFGDVTELDNHDLDLLFSAVARNDAPVAIGEEDEDSDEDDWAISA